METTTVETFAEGDRVCLKGDPSEEHGVIVEATVNKAQWLVAWASGKVWIYPSSDLIPVAS